jgi:hypothetical protein
VCVSVSERLCLSLRKGCNLRVKGEVFDIGREIKKGLEIHVKRE